MGFSYAKAGAILNQEFVSPVVYLALYITDPTPNDTGTEVSGAGYARQEIEFSTPAQETGKMTIKNTEDIRFPIAEENWGTITHIGFRTAATGGNLIAFGELVSPRTIQTGDRFVIDLNNGVVRLA